MDELSKTFPKIHIESFQKTNMISGLSVLIPKGPKAFAWFTYLHKHPICILLHIEGNEIQKISHVYVSFKESLSLGTIVYGTLLNQQFIMENLYYEKGTMVYLSYSEKIERMKTILDDIQKCEFKESLQFYLPKMVERHHLLEASNMPYPVYGIVSIQQMRMFVLNYSFCTFLVKRKEEMEDVYELHALDDTNTLQLVSTALINDFKTSHFMKKNAYKNKPTYKNIELSDSEEEEDLGDFFVSGLFIPEFKRWKPYASNIGPPSFLRDIKLKERIFYNSKIP
jgi:hypothetical protein